MCYARLPTRLACPSKWVRWGKISSFLTTRGREQGEGGRGREKGGGRREKGTGRREKGKRKKAGRKRDLDPNMRSKCRDIIASWCDYALNQKYKTAERPPSTSTLASRAFQDAAANFSSATLSWVPVTSAGSGFRAGSLMRSDMASAAAFLSLSASSTRTSCFPPTRSLDSFSSSLSPRLNGSFSVSPTGLGSTVDSGCHLLCLLAVAVFSLVLGRGEAP